jgi:hypothetical protein
VVKNVIRLSIVELFKDAELIDKNIRYNKILLPIYLIVCYFLTSICYNYQ